MQSKSNMQLYVEDLLSKNLPPTYFYHDLDHTLYVQQKALEIGKYENCTDKELELVSAGALWHDTGYIKMRTGHEKEGCLLARKHLPEFGFTIKEVDLICGMIMATKIPQSPKNKLEAIVADADLEYLGTSQAAYKAGLLFKEMKSLNPELTEADWNVEQINFLRHHQYFTNYCKEKKEDIKQDYLKSLLKQSY